MLCKYILIVEILYLTCYLVSYEAITCPNKSDKQKYVPNILSLLKDQSSYRSRVEIIGDGFVSIEVEEFYNSIQRSGWFRYRPALKVSTLKQIYYYQESSEKFVMENSKCSTKRLDQQTSQETINEWIKPDNLSNLISNDYEILGPSMLLLYVKSIENETQFIGKEQIEGYLTDHWFHCVDSGPFIDFWFNAESMKPFRVSIIDPEHSDPLAVYNFITFEPSEPESVVYPYGFGCQSNDQLTPSVKAFPWNKTLNSFSLEMEAVISYKPPDTSILTTAKITKYQETFSFELKDESKVTRIVQNGQHLGRYLINLQTGQCEIDEIHQFEVDPTSGHNHITSWPFHNQLEFNLLTKIILDDDVKVHYMGTEVTSHGETYEIYEKLINGFFLYDSSSKIDAVADYFFTVSPSSGEQQPVPSKIIIKPINIDTIVFHQPIPDLIEITTINHSEDLTGETINDQFDVSNCYNDVGRYLWFQLVLSDSQDIPRSDLEIIKSGISKLLETFIPIIRLPETKVTISDLNVYVTCKLLERPSTKFDYVSQDSYTIDNPSLVIGQDHLEDCGQLCTEDANCFEFSYCRDTRCLIFSPEIPSLAEISFNSNCSLLRKTVYNLDTEDVLSSNILSSSRTILHQLKQKLDLGLIVLPELNLSADDLFIVDGPEDIGSLTRKFKDDQYDSRLEGKNYRLIGNNRRLLTGSSTINGISYRKCLSLCENDNNCYSLSFCSSSITECVLSSERKLTDAFQLLTGYGDGCEIFEKSYLSFYNKFPGSSLVVDALESIENIDSTDCARRCLQMNSTCQSFDYCKSINRKESNAESICFLHAYHVSADQAHLINGNIWDFGQSACDHYAKQLSRDYQHLPGIALNDPNNNLITIISEMKDISLERCASKCNQSPDNCKLFEFCENIGQKDQNNFISSCRLSTYKPTGIIDNQAIRPSVNQCSIYVNQRPTSNQDKLIENNYSMAITLNAFFFIGAFACGAIASIYYHKHRNV